MMRRSACRQPACSIDLSEAPIWRGAVAPVATPYSATTQDALRRLRAMVVEGGPEQGIAPALADSGATSALERAFTARLRNALPRLARATERGDAGAASDAMARLIGLGPGLTPAGDDFLCGYLAALWSRAPFDAALRGFLPALAHALSPLLARTHAISRQMLRDAMRGDSRAVSRGTGGDCREGRSVDAARHVLSSGHSSGADTLCGLLFGYDPGVAVAVRISRRVRRAPPFHRCRAPRRRPEQESPTCHPLWSRSCRANTAIRCR